MNNNIRNEHLIYNNSDNEDSLLTADKLLMKTNNNLRKSEERTDEDGTETADK